MAERRDTAILPSRWGAGSRLAASGLDGDTGDGLVGELLADRIGLRFVMMEERRVWFEVPPGVGVDGQTWTGTALEIRLTPSDAGRIVVGMHDAQTLIGTLPGSVRIRTGMGSGVSCGTPGGASADFTALLTKRHGASREVFSYAYDRRSAEAAARRAEKGLSGDPEHVLRSSSAWLNSRPMPALSDPAFTELYAKALAVLRQSTLLPRDNAMGLSVVPLRNRDAERLQIDSVVAADAWARFDPETAVRILIRIVESQDGDTGLVPGCLDGKDATGALVAHPPLLAQLGAELARHRACREPLVSVYPSLKRHVRGWVLHRAFDSSGVLCWRRASGCEPAFEAGMGSSPRFGEGVDRAAGADVNVWVLREIDALRELAEGIGSANDPELAWFDHAARAVRRGLFEFLWDDDDGVFQDRCRPRSSPAPRTSALVLPLAAGILPRRHAASLAALLRDPGVFGTRMPLPSVAARDPVFAWGPGGSREPWHGGVWPHVNSCIAAGLEACGLDAEAIDLARATLAGIQGVYERRGILLGCYDPQGERPEAEREDPVGSGLAVDPVLTAAAVVRLCFILASLEHRKRSAAPDVQVAGLQRPGSGRRRTARLAWGAAAVAAVAVVVSLNRPGSPAAAGRARPHAMAAAAIGSSSGRGDPDPLGIAGTRFLQVGAGGELTAQATARDMSSPGGLPAFGAVRPGAVDPWETPSLAEVKNLVMEGDYAKAATAAHRCLEARDAHPSFRYWLAASLWRLGDLSGALDAARGLAGETDPRLPAEMRRWAARFVESHASGVRGEDPLRAGTEAGSRTPQHVLPDATADAESGAGRRAPAWREADAAAARLMGLGDWQAACAVLRRQTALYPDEPLLWARLADALEGAGDVESARLAQATFRRLSAAERERPVEGGVGVSELR